MRDPSENQIQSFINRKYLNIRIIFDQNIFQNNMDKPFTSIKQTDSLQKITNISIIESEKESLQQQINHRLQSLQPEDGLKFLDLLQSTSHTVLCHKAQLHLKLQHFYQAKQYCQRIFQMKICCRRCIFVYLEVNEILQTKKLNFIDFFIQYLNNHNYQDDKLYTSIMKMKRIQEGDEHFGDLFQNLLNSGAEFSKITIVKDKDKNNRTVVARNQIEKDQTILYIPKDKLILLENARQSEIVKKIHQEKLYLRSPKHCQLTIFLLEQDQLGSHSPYYFYMKHLPQTFDTFPINFKPQELQYLKGSPFLEQVQQKNIDIKRDYDAIISVCTDFSRFSYENFRKFRLLVSSRIFGISIGNIRTDVLAPLADMLNHNIPKQTCWFYSDQYEGFVIKSIRQIQKGEQIYDSYGQKCNSRFLLNYGFTILQNQANQVAIKIPFQYQEQSNVQSLTQITLKVPKNIQSKQFQQMVSILRFSVMHERMDSKQSIEIMKQTPYMGSDLQAQIWQKLQKILETQIAAYPTTFKDDKKLLNSKELTTNHYNCIVLRKGEKEILNYYLTMAKRMIKYFRSGASLKAIQQLQEYQTYLKKLNFS